MVLGIGENERIGVICISQQLKQFSPYNVNDSFNQSTRKGNFT